MEEKIIDRYVDNLDVNTQADLLKKVLNLLFIFKDKEDEVFLLKDKLMSLMNNLMLTKM